MTTTSRPDRLGIVLRWPIVIALVSWRYMWRTTPLHRSEEAGGRADLPSPLADVPEDGLQPLAALLYNKLRLAKEIQLNMWSHFWVRVAALAGGRPRGGVTIRTRWVTWPPPAGDA